jgi:hypothetical protein
MYTVKVAWSIASIMKVLRLQLFQKPIPIVWAFEKVVPQFIVEL